MIATPTITLFNNSTSYNLTSRTYGATCATECQPGQFGRATASFDFYNNDGAMTPGGGGTYSSIDWFSMAIRITAVTDAGLANCFAGIITDFELIDDGRNSYVRLSAVDAFTIGGSTATTVATGAGTYGGTVTYWINSFYNGNTTIINSVVNITLNLIDHKMTLQQAIDAGRISVSSAGSGVTLETNRLPASAASGLVALGYTVSSGDVGSVQAVLIDQQTGKQYGGADDRREGKVIGLPQSF